MKFEEMKYDRPDFMAFEKEFLHSLEKFSKSLSFEEQNKAMVEVNELRKEFETSMTLVSIRHSINTEDKYYEDEQNYFDQNS